MSKITQPPIGIIITMGKQVVEANGGLLTFIRHFESAVSGDDQDAWYHKSKNRPIHDIAQVYVIVANRLAYRVYYGGYQTGPTSVFMYSGEERKIDWGRMILSGPFEKAPRKIRMTGFQGFRYVSDPLW